MSEPFIDLSDRANALDLRDRLKEVVTASEAAETARINAVAEGQTEAGEYFTLCKMNAAEEHLVALTSDPKLRGFLAAAVEELTTLLGEVA